MLNGYVTKAADCQLAHESVGIAKKLLLGQINKWGHDGQVAAQRAHWDVMTVDSRNWSIKVHSIHVVHN